MENSTTNSEALRFTEVIHQGLEQKHARAKLYWFSLRYTELPKCSTLRFDKPDPILLSDNNWNMQFCLLDTDKTPTGLITSKVLMTQKNLISAARAIWLILSVDQACFEIFLFDIWCLLNNSLAGYICPSPCFDRQGGRERVKSSKLPPHHLQVNGIQVRTPCFAFCSPHDTQRISSVQLIRIQRNITLGLQTICNTSNQGKFG